MRSSLFSALCGWIAGALLLAVEYQVEFLQTTKRFATAADFLGITFAGALSTLPFVIAVWLLALWPLYRLVPRSSRLWHPVACSACGALAGTFLDWLVLRFVVSNRLDLALIMPQLAIGAVTGLVTCAVGSQLRRREARSAPSAA